MDRDIILYVNNSYEVLHSLIFVKGNSLYQGSYLLCHDAIIAYHSCCARYVPGSRIVITQAFLNSDDLRTISKYSKPPWTNFFFIKIMLSNEYFFLNLTSTTNHLHWVHRWKKISFMKRHLLLMFIIFHFLNH